MTNQNKENSSGSSLNLEADSAKSNIIKVKIMYAPFSQEWKVAEFDAECDIHDDRQVEALIESTLHRYAREVEGNTYTDYVLLFNDERVSYGVLNAWKESLWQN